MFVCLLVCLFVCFLCIFVFLFSFVFAFVLRKIKLFHAKISVYRVVYIIFCAKKCNFDAISMESTFEESLFEKQNVYF